MTFFFELLQRLTLIGWETRKWQKITNLHVYEQHLVILCPPYVLNLRSSLWHMLLFSNNNVKWSNSKVLSGKLIILNAEFSVHICIPACSCWFNLKTILQPPDAFSKKQVSCVNIMETNSQQKTGRCQPGYSGKQFTGKY